MKNALSKIVLLVVGVLMVSTCFPVVGENVNNAANKAVVAESTDISVEMINTNEQNELDIPNVDLEKYTLNSSLETEQLKVATETVQRRVRVGAVCNDGWNSKATGRGACSHHGGVHHWVYKTVN